MNRMAKISIAGAFGGVLVTVAIAASMQSPPRPQTETVIVPDEAVDTDDLRAELTRCRTITEADPDCEAVWEAERRRFFRNERTPK